MSANRLAGFVCRVPYSTSSRIASLVVGTSGRQYVRGKVLHHDERNRPTVFKAIFLTITITPPEAGAETSLLFSSTYLSPSTVTLGSSRLSLRVPVGFECPLITTTTDESSFNSYFTDTLLSLVRADPDVPANELKKILRYAGEGIQEFHVKGWLHNDIKPDNIFVNWTHAADNNKKCIYALGGADLLLLEDDQELAELAANGISPEQAILTRHFSYFGPATTGLFQQVDSHWHDVLKGVSADAVRALRDFPDQRFEVWGKALGPMALDMISGMTNPDPTARPTINEVLEHPWWEEP